MMITNKFILGTAQLGIPYGINNKGRPLHDESLAILKAAQGGGINTLDTADAYGDATNIISDYHHSNPEFNIINKFKNDGTRIEEKVKSSLHKLGIKSFYAYLF